MAQAKFDPDYTGRPRFYANSAARFVKENADLIFVVGDADATQSFENIHRDVRKTKVSFFHDRSTWTTGPGGSFSGWSQPLKLPDR